MDRKVSDCAQRVSDLHDKVESEGGKLVTIVAERRSAAHTEIDILAGKSNRQLNAKKESLGRCLAQATCCLEAAQRVPRETSAMAVCMLSQVELQ